MNMEGKTYTYLVIIPPEVDVLTDKEDINEEELDNLSDVPKYVADELEIDDITFKIRLTCVLKFLIRRKNLSKMLDTPKNLNDCINYLIILTMKKYIH